MGQEYRATEGMEGRREEGREEGRREEEEGEGPYNHVQCVHTEEEREPKWYQDPESWQNWMLYSSVHNADHITARSAVYSEHRNAATTSNENKFLKRLSQVLLLHISPHPKEHRSHRVDGITGCANAFIIMGPVLCDPLISPVDFHHLPATDLGFI